MAYPIEEDLLPVGRDTNRPGTPIAVRGIVAHRTGNPRADARAHRRYFGGGYRGASAHYFVDSQRILRIVPEGEMAWHAGVVTAPGWKRGNPNTWAVGIELCEDHPLDTPQGQEAYRRYVWLHADICLRHGLDPRADILGHFQVDPRNRPQDPLGLFDWGRFLDDVAAVLARERHRSAPSPPAWDPAAEVARLRERGIIDQQHDPGLPPTWGELAAVANRLLDRIDRRGDR